MRILVLNYEFPPLGGGAAPVSRDISIQLQKAGHEVTVITMGFDSLPAYEELQGVRIYRLKCWRRKKNSCKPWEQFSYLTAVWHFMKKHMQMNEYDVCHTHFVIPTGEAARCIRRKYGIPYVITAHGSDVEGHNQKLSMKVMHRVLRTGWRKIVRQSMSVIAPSVYLLELMKHNYPKGRYVYIPNGINWEKYHDFAEVQNKEKKILLMGRLQSFKNVQTVLRALSMVNLRDWSVDILGDGPYREKLEQLSAELGLAQKVSFWGWIDNGTEEQYSFIRRASVYISASKFENCPMSVIETVAAGCYPLLSDIPAHRQLIAEDEYYFAKEDATELAGKISKFIDGETIIKSTISQKVIEYDWSYIVKSYEDVLESAGEEKYKC